MGKIKNDRLINTSYRPQSHFDSAIFIFLIGISIFIFLFTSGCENGITNPVNSIGDLCYEKFANNHWEIFTNNISGTNPQNISNYSDDDEYPRWSPDGRYIVYSRSQSLGGLLIIVYDTKTQTSKDISDGGEADLQPQWTPNSKVFFGYSYSWSKYHGTYLMNPDGSDRKKILDTTATIYFYNDSYNFLYVLEHTKVYKTNIDNTFNELLLDLPSSGSEQYYTIRDFNPSTGNLLVNSVNTKTLYNSPNFIATLNVETKQLTPIVTAEDDYVLYFEKYSKNFSKIAFIEYSNNDEYLSVLENGNKKRLQRITASNPPVHFSHVPMEFSPDGKYIAFSKQIFHSGQWVTFSTPLFIVNVDNGAVHQLEDEAHGPSWNPQQ